MLEFFFELGQKIERRIAGWVGTFSFIECPLSINKGYLYPTTRNKGPFLTARCPFSISCLKNLTDKLARLPMSARILLN